MHLHLSAAPRVAFADGSVRELAALDAALLAWLALEGPTPRARIAALLWPASGADAARNVLRQRLYQLKRHVGVELVVGSGTLALAPDVLHDLEDADSVLADVADGFAAEFGQWLEVQRQRRRSRVRQSLVELAEMAERVRDWDDALVHARELLALEPLSEEAHRRVMRLHYLRGDRAAALLAFDACERLLKDEVGARPSAETLALLATIEASPRETTLRADLPVPASVLRPPRLVGREHELAQLARAWQAGQVAALIGEAGMGKTRLLQTFVAARPGVVFAAGRPGDAGVPFATLARLLRAVMAREEAGTLVLAPAPARRELARVLPELDVAPPQCAGEGQRLVLQRALSDLLATRHGLAGLIVDDLHFADEASLEMLGALIGERGPTPHWALACRPAEAGSPLRALHDGLVDEARLMPVALAPLAAAQLAELVDSLALPGVQGAALASGLLKRTGGNPLFVLETLKQAWVDRTLADLADMARLPRPATVGRLIERRVAQLSPGALALARAAAVAGVDFDIALAEHVLGVSALQFTDALNELEAAQVMRGPQFAHDLVFEAVHASVPQAIACHLHARIAGWLEQHGGESARIAGHWRAAGRADAALPWLHKAAERAALASRQKEAAGFFETAAETELARGDCDAAFATLERLCRLHHNSRLHEDERRVAQRLVELATSARQRALAAVSLGWAHFCADTIGPAEQQAMLALATAETAGDALLGARAHELLGVVCSAAERFGEAIVHLRTALPTLQREGDTRARVEAAGHLALLLDQQGRIAEAAEPHAQTVAGARAMGDLSTLGTALRNASINRVHAGDAAGACAMLEEALRVAAQTDNASGSEYSHTLITACCADLGRFAQALEHAERALEHFRHHDVGWLGPTRTTRAALWLHLGQFTRALQELDAPVPDRIPAHSQARRLMLRARTLIGLGQGSGSLLVDALALAPTSGRTDARMLIQLERMRIAEPADVLRIGAEIGEQARASGMGGFELWALVRMARAAHAATPAERAAWRTRIEVLAPHTHCYSMARAELWLARAALAQSTGDGEAAAQAAAEGAAWVRARAAKDVPEPFRDAFLQRQPFNRDLLAVATRLAQA